jgi:hypothetical protein
MAPLRTYSAGRTIGEVEMNRKVPAGDLSEHTTLNARAKGNNKTLPGPLAPLPLPPVDMVSMGGKVHLVDAGSEATLFKSNSVPIMVKMGPIHTNLPLATANQPKKKMLLPVNNAWTSPEKGNIPTMGNIPNNLHVLLP